MKLLSIVPISPYDGIGHAGGKTYNYYIKRLISSDSMSVEVLIVAPKEELAQCDICDHDATITTIPSKGSIRLNIFRVISDLYGKLTDGYGFLFSYYKKYKIMDYLDELKQKNNLPDVIELEWTEMVLMAKLIKTKYPHVKIIASEHDVSFQGYERKYIENKNILNRIRYKQMKRLELEALAYCDCVMVQSSKDRDILLEEGISSGKIFVLTPYYHDMRFIQRERINNDILFWGAMYRPENYVAAIWFINNVMPLLSHLDVRFVIAGNRPPKKLINYNSNRINVTGFVEDESSLFKHSLCFVSPLLTGAGIKVKVIEALSSRIPVLTNQIGIEGIPAVDGESFFLCTKPEDYAEVIEKLYYKKLSQSSIGKNEEKIINKCFDLNQSVRGYMKMIRKLGE